MYQGKAPVSAVHSSGNKVRITELKSMIANYTLKAFSCLIVDLSDPASISGFVHLFLVLYRLLLAALEWS